MSEHWEQRVYNHYATTGNLPTQPNPAQLFGLNQPYIEKVIREHFPNERNARILELGCGPAPFLYALKQRGYSNLVGVDVSPEQVALAHAIGLEKEVQEGDMLTFLDTSATEHYDIIILFDILEHFDRAKQFEIMDIVFARLKPAGKCILHVPNAEAHGGVKIFFSDITHKSAFTRRSMEQLLRTVGFKEVKCYEDKPIPHSLFSFIRRLIWELVTLGQVIIIGSETGNIKRRKYILSRNMLTVARKTL